MEYGPGDSVLALMYEDDTGHDVHVGMDTDPANALMLPMPTAVPPSPLWGRERRSCRFHAAEDVYHHRLSSSWRREATLLVGALERYEFQSPRRVAREKGLEDMPPMRDWVCCVQLGGAAVLNHTRVKCGRLSCRNTSHWRCA